MLKEFEFKQQRLCSTRNHKKDYGTKIWIKILRSEDLRDAAWNTPSPVPFYKRKKDYGTTLTVLWASPRRSSAD